MNASSEVEIETVLVRPPWFYGPNQPPRQTLFFRMIRAGKAPIVGSGRNLRSMSYIDNLCQGLLLAAMTPRANGQTYWIADRRPLLDERNHRYCRAVARNRVWPALRPQAPPPPRTRRFHRLRPGRRNPGGWVFTIRSSMSCLR